MTKEEILAIEVGRELDELVAESIMKHEKPNFFPSNALELCLSGNAFHIPSWTCICIYEEGDVPRWVPDLYSTDWSATGQVVEKMKEEGYNLHIEYYSPKTVWAAKDRLTDVLFSDPRGFYPGNVTGDMALPEAICKAALLTKVGIGA